MKVLITGANGFIGKNLLVKLRELPEFDVRTWVRGDSIESLMRHLKSIDAVIHLAGENRPVSSEGYDTGNVLLTKQLCHLMRDLAINPPVLFTSSVQATQNNAYGISKKAAEKSLESYAELDGGSVTLCRLPGVFGKWCRPDYNSVVATFCHNVARGLPINVNDPDHSLKLVHIDDVVSSFIAWLEAPKGNGVSWRAIEPEHETTVGDLEELIRSFFDSRAGLVTDKVGSGFIRALYSTYVSYIPKDRFQYEIPSYGDERGVFVEMLKTTDSGQFSFFTAHPGVVRGGHYHHTKTEKFLVIKGKAIFKFRHILTNEKHTIETYGDKPTVVETIPGWSHDIKNVGDDELVVMLWANEIFDRNEPDTIPSGVHNE